MDRLSSWLICLILPIDGCNHEVAPSFVSLGVEYRTCFYADPLLFAQLGILGYVQSLFQFLQVLLVCHFIFVLYALLAVPCGLHWAAMRCPKFYDMGVHEHIHLPPARQLFESFSCICCIHNAVAKTVGICQYMLDFLSPGMVASTIAWKRLPGCAAPKELENYIFWHATRWSQCRALAKGFAPSFPTLFASEVLRRRCGMKAGSRMHHSEMDVS